MELNITYLGLENMPTDPQPAGELMARIKHATDAALQMASPSGYSPTIRISLARETYYDYHNLYSYHEPGWFCWPQWGATSEMRYYCVIYDDPDDGANASPIYREPMTGEYEFWM